MDVAKGIQTMPLLLCAGWLLVNLKQSRHWEEKSSTEKMAILCQPVSKIQGAFPWLMINVEVYSPL